MIIIKKNFKNNKFLYYFKGFFSLLIPNFFYKNKLQRLLISIPDNKLDYILKRVNYYNKIENKISTNKTWSKLSDLQIKSKGKTYFFDSYSIVKYFPKSLKANFLFGDINYVPN